MKKNPTTLLVCLLLGLTTVALYWPITRQGFVDLDDPTYVCQNSHVQSGLTWSGIVWAFTSGYGSNWHPLTWISHMLDCQIYGLNPSGHHFTNLLFHALNSVLVFLVFRRLTGAFWRSAFVAALFAWHPLHVESVAWAAERKDVLSTFFFLLTLLAYAEYVRRKSIQYSVIGDQKSENQAEGAESPRSHVLWYSLSLLLFALGLMSKPMVLTLPCVLLLLDVWPLRRLQLSPFRLSTLNSQLSTFLEKVPFFILSVGSSVVTFFVQKSGGAVASFASIPPGARLANALVAYPRYLLKAFWPAHLSVFYPLPDQWPLLSVISASLLLLLLTALAVRWAMSRPYFIVGWFWFIGTLVPTIGLVQVGSQSMADRYMYIPSLGLFLIVTWGLADIIRARWPDSNLQPSSVAPVEPARGLVLGLLAVALLGCVVCTSRQIRYWHDEETLFRHAMETSPDNYLAYDHLAKVCEGSNRKAEAEFYYLALLRLKPRYPEGQYNLGNLEMERGNLAAAAEHLTAAAALRPGFASAHCNLGLTLFRQNHLPEAADQLELASQLAPRDSDVRVNLGVTLLALNSPAKAAAAFTQALALQPDSPSSHFLLALALSRAQKPKEALRQAERAHELAISAGQAGVAAKAAELLKVCQSSE